MRVPWLRRAGAGVALALALAAGVEAADGPGEGQGACNAQALAAASSYDTLYSFLRCDEGTALQAARRINALEPLVPEPPRAVRFASSAPVRTVSLALDLFFDPHLSRPPLRGFFALQQLLEQMVMIDTVESVSLESGVDAHEGATGESARLAADRAEQVRRWLAGAALSQPLPITVTVRAVPTAMPALAVDRSVRIRVRGRSASGPAWPATQPAAAGQPNPLPRYPPVAKRLGEQGRVLLRIQVSEDGSIVSPRVLASSGFPRLDAAALDVVRAWRIERNDAAPNSWFNLPFNFILEDPLPPAQPPRAP